MTDGMDFSCFRLSILILPSIIPSGPSKWRENVAVHPKALSFVLLVKGRTANDIHFNLATEEMHQHVWEWKVGWLVENILGQGRHGSEKSWKDFSASSYETHHLGQPNMSSWSSCLNFK